MCTATMRSVTSTMSVATSATLTTSMTSPPSPGELPPPALVGRQHRQHSLHHELSPDPKSMHAHHQQHHQDSDSNDGNSDDRSDIDDGEGVDGMRSGKRKRPISVSCELCKQRKVKCDRGQPACGWCTRNGASCEYKERKKPGLRAGYGRELEARLDKLEAILRKHSEVLHVTLDASGQPIAVPVGIASHSQFQNTPAAAAGRPASSVGGSLASEDRGTPQDHHAASSSIFGRGDASAPTPQAEAALFLQKPSTSAFSASHSSSGGPPNLTNLPGRSAGINANGMDLGMTSPGAVHGSGGAYSQSNAAMAGISPSHHSQPSPLSTPAAREYYGASAPGAATATGAAGTSTSSPMMNLTTGKSHIGSDQDLPPYDLTYALVDLYFKHINTWCPLLQRNPTIEALFGPTMTDETNKILLHAIVATTLRYSTDSRLTDEKRQLYHDISKNRVLLYGMENSSVKALQAMVILALDFCGSSNGPPGWNIMALITRAVVQLGLAVESNSLSVSPSFASIYTLRAMILPEAKDFIEEESRRRLFWVIYLLDRYATIATAFEFALDDREIDRMLPCRDDLWAKNQKVETRLFHTDYTPGGINEGPGSLGANGFEPEAGGPSGSSGKPENLGAFSYYIEILGILTKIHNFLKQPVDISSLSDVEQWQMRYRELDQTLNSWKVGLPGEYGNMAKLFQPNCAKVINCGWIMLHITYHTAIIRLHSSSAYPTTRSPIFTPSYSASQRCHTAVENIGSLCEFVVSNNLLPKLGPPFAFSLWVAARLYLVHGSTVEHKLSARVSYFVDTLRAMGRYWPVANRYSLLLQRVLDEHGESERHGDGVTPGSVKILADMRRTAFDLDLLIGQQPRHVSGNSTYSTGQYGHYAHESGVHGHGGGHGLGGHPMSRFQSQTPARTPQPNELEYLDVFDFFNVPRLPFGLPTEMNGNGIHVHS
ncbi:c6 transcription factor [Ophiostoma piceae UAMH 11346]|uniref:C6 transcription factor n=1 Tax=Ophiostoma piceae (strain UAMH 11346) TaxID=1262450 RepID=S3C515_OPHP1|nr:c6 transcription factor [Ophiostoma piceae UAMH 11346]